MLSLYELMPRFRELFTGLPDAFGTGAGQWVKRPANAQDWIRHLQGDGPGIGIAPLMRDSTVRFAAIDLDEPDFDAAREMQKYIPGHSFIERSRSGNAHVWVYFKDPVQAWVPMGILKEACFAAGKEHVEVFPKNHDFTRVRLGNYINLPYHGEGRPVIGTEEGAVYTLEGFLDAAGQSLNDPYEWERRAGLLQLTKPGERSGNVRFGEQQQLHMCAEYIIEHCEDHPLIDGHRNAVFFCLAKCLTNWEQCDHDEALSYLRQVNDAALDKSSDFELRRILRNAEQGQYTSTGCDDVLVQEYAHPDCPIANPRSA